ncbi:4416_t:CDS:2 [Gigaspora margarita]|uniref:4416_t:CDS:1 n=1 Tax=Gigaspora margarita TaxID=4874 RepID=A0ABM8W3I5_GIGMA|nr:4416_t:CDS:2 [Gigaspora margarita]
MKWLPTSLNTFFDGQTWEHYRIDYCGPNLPPCHMTHNRTYLNQSHLLIFHVPDMNWVELPDKEIKNMYNNKIPRVYYSVESPAHD